MGTSLKKCNSVNGAEARSGILPMAMSDAGAEIKKAESQVFVPCCTPRRNPASGGGPRR